MWRLVDNLPASGKIARGAAANFSLIKRRLHGRSVRYHEVAWSPFQRVKYVGSSVKSLWEVKYMGSSVESIREVKYMGSSVESL